jgi:hypothetical protein
MTTKALTSQMGSTGSGVSLDIAVRRTEGLTDPGDLLPGFGVGLGMSAFSVNFSRFERLTGRIGLVG